jgi:hypothetical protein
MVCTVGPTGKCSGLTEVPTVDADRPLFVGNEMAQVSRDERLRV